VRFIGGGDFVERSLSCFAGVPQGALVWIMEGDAQSVLEAADAACGDSLAALGGRPPLGMIAFDCIARRGVLAKLSLRRRHQIAQNRRQTPRTRKHPTRDGGSAGR
jgi:hypothetical protein